MKVMLKFWQKIKSDLPVMSRGSGLPQKFKVMSEGRAGLKKVQSRGVPGGGMVPEQFEWHITKGFSVMLIWYH